MKTKRNSLSRLLFFGILVFPSTAFGQEIKESVPDRPGPAPLTFEKVVSEAIQNRPLIEQALASLAVAQSQATQAASAYAPSLNGQASWQHSLPKQQEETAGQVVDLTPTDYWTFQVGASEMLYDFGRREFKIKVAREGVRSAQNNLEQVKSNLAYQAAQTFLDLVFLKEEVASLEDQHADLVRHLDTVDTRIRVGSGTKYDQLKTKIRISTLDDQRIDALGQEKKRSLVLSQLVGVPLSEQDIQGDFEPKSVTVDLSSLVRKALNGRPEIEAAKTDVDNARFNEKIAALAWAPTLSATVASGYANPILTQNNTDLNTPIFNWSVGVSLQFSDVNVPLAASQADEARHRSDVVRQRLAQVNDDVSQEVETTYQDFKSSVDAWNNARERQDESAQALEIAKTQYNLGAITNDAYLDTQLAFEQARLDLITALYHEVSSYFELQRVTGVLVPSEGVSTE